LKLERGQATATYEDKNVKPDKNFILHYTVSDKDVGLNLMTYRKSAEDGYFMLLVSPGQLENRAMDKDIIFVIDSSGSMSGEKIGQAKDALRYCINNLKPGDRFSIVNFSTGISSFEDSLVTATKDKVNAALNFINDISGSGGTDINDALLTAFRMFNDPQRPRMIVFLTDGEPTEGVVGLKDIVENVKQANTLKTRIFVFGVGDNVNTHLLDKLAQVNRGISEYVLPNENIELKLTSFYRKISEPVLSDISIDFAGIKTKDLYPKDLPDIFKGSQLVVVGRYINSGPAKITLKGKINGAQKDFIYDVDFSEQDQTSDFIPRIWATRKIGYLLSEIRFTGANDELKNEIERLSKEFGIITPYTSFILDASQKQSSDSLGAHTSFYEQSYSKGMLGVSQSRGLSGSNLGTELTMRVSAGANAVKLAQGIGDMQSSAVLSASAALTVKQAGDKTFRIRDDGVWVDSSFKEGSKLIKVKYLSKEYFELLHKTALVAKYLSLGKNIIVVVDGQAYQVIE
ncbi:MAG: VWA domain-containing protein, partial [Candidatus Omnitrophica bacterium]|nr:VWA domain-containing protein [Candidatus Omnitrophota bacterium]